MSDSNTHWSIRLIKLLASSVSGPALMGEMCAVALGSIAGKLIGLINAEVATDIRRVNDAFIQKKEAETSIIVEEAAEATNRNNLSKRRDAIAAHEKQRLRLENAKTEAEIESIRVETETKRQTEIIRAEATLIEAMSKLKQAGGDVAFNSQNLRDIQEKCGSPLQNYVEQSTDNHI